MKVYDWLVFLTL